MTTTRYGSGALYGDAGLVYGTSATPDRRITFALEVDWDNDGVFDGQNENEYLLGFTERRGREFVFSGDGFDHVGIGVIEFELLNESGRFDPYNESSPLFDALYGNQKVRFRIYDELNTVMYDDFVGYITNIKPNYGDVKTVSMYVSDAVINLRNTKIKSSTIATSATYHARIAQALTEVGWTDSTSIDSTVSDTMPYHWFSGRTAEREINDLSDAAFGVFFIDSAGRAIYKSRVASDVSTQTLTDADVDYYYGLQAPAPREVIRNLITVFARARTAVTNAEIWRLGDKPQLAAGEGGAIWANFSYNNEEVPATSVTDPVATTDYTANDAIDGSGTNRTANMSFALTKFATSAKIIPSNSGSSAFLTFLRLRGNIIVSDKYTFAQVQDSTSITAFGEKELVIKSEWLQDVNAANEIGQVLLQKFSTPRSYPRFKFKRSALDKMYGSDLFDLITVNFDNARLTGEFRIGYIERSWNISQGYAIDTTVYCEPNLTVATSGDWTFPTTFPTTFPV